MQEKKGGQKLKSISVLVPFERVQASLSEIGFLLDDTVTIVADGKVLDQDAVQSGMMRRSASQKRLEMPTQRIR